MHIYFGFLPVNPFSILAKDRALFPFERAEREEESAWVWLLRAAKEPISSGQVWSLFLVSTKRLALSPIPASSREALSSSSTRKKERSSGVKRSNLVFSGGSDNALKIVEQTVDTLAVLEKAAVNDRILRGKKLQK